MPAVHLRLLKPSDQPSAVGLHDLLGAEVVEVGCQLNMSAQ